MLINTILDKLTKPEVLSDGTIREPNTIMLKAAEVIKQLYEFGQRNMSQPLVEEVIDHEAAYRDAMNADYSKNCT